MLPELLLAATLWSSHVPNGGRAAALAAAPSNPRILYAGFPYASSESLPTPEASASVSRVVVQPGNPRNLFASTAETFTGFRWDGRIFRSLNGGVSWDPIPDPSPQGRHMIAVDTDGTLIATAYGEQSVYRLPPGGNAFEVVNRSFDVWVQDVASDSAGAIYVLTERLLHRTRDGGLTWEGLYAGGKTMQISPSNPDIIYVTNFRSILWTRDGGATWQQSTQEMLDGPVVPAPSNPSVVYGVFRTGEIGRQYHRIGRSDNDGGNFTGKGVPSENARVSALAVDPDDWRRIWVATQDGLFLSTDAALTFQDANGNLPTRSIRWITIRDGTIHLGTDQGVWSMRGPARRRAVR
jgi:photosystem II stability/assembly factor-like uncharacterized protein